MNVCFMFIATLGSTQQCGLLLVCFPTADAIRDADIKIVSVAVGSLNNDSRSFFSTIGGGQGNSYISANDFNALSGIVDDVTKSACTDLDISVSCTSGFVGGQLSLEADLSNTAAFGVDPPIVFNVTLTNGLTNLTVVSATNGPNAICVAQDASRYICTAGTSGGTALAPGGSWRYKFISTPTQTGTSSSTITYDPAERPDNNDGNNVATCSATILPSKIVRGCSCFCMCAIQCSSSSRIAQLE